MGTDLNTIADSAKSLYDQGLYRAALGNYEQLFTAQVKDDELFYNMGNCYARMGELGEAKLFYERAIIYNPSNADASHNLDWVNLRITDALVEPRQELIEWVGQWGRSVTDADSWALIGWGIIGISIILLIARKTFVKSLNWRWPFTTSILALLIILVGNLSVPRMKKAIVVERNSYGYSEPSTNSKRIVLLSEGSAGTIVSTNDSWYYVELGDGRLAWFNTKEWKYVLPGLD